TRVVQTGVQTNIEGCTAINGVLRIRGPAVGALFKVQTTCYVDAEGKRVPKGTPGARMVRLKSRKWYGQYRAADGRRRRVPLSTDKQSAKAMLAALERREEQAKAGLVTAAEARVVEHQARPILGHLDDYLASLERTATTKHVREVRSILGRI